MQIQLNHGLQKQHEDFIDHQKRVQTDLAERNKELSRLRNVERELKGQLILANQQEQRLRNNLQRTVEDKVAHKETTERTGNGNQIHPNEEYSEIQGKNQNPSCASMQNTNRSNQSTSTFDSFSSVTADTLRLEIQSRPASMIDKAQTTGNHSALPVYAGRTSQEMAARQAVAKELPTFDGDPINWPLFSSNYLHSTEICGCSNFESLLRLQRSLKGVAKEAVSSFLLHPVTVPQVFANLECCMDGQSK